MEPIAGGFDQDEAIANAVSVRVTRPGLDFIGDNAVSVATNLLGGTGGAFAPVDGKLTFNIPAATQALGMNLCPKGPDANANPPTCAAQIGIGEATLRVDGVAPNAIRVAGTVPLVVANLPIFTEGSDFHVGVGQGSCEFGPNKSAPKVTPKTVALEIVIPVIAETTAARKGYTKLDLDNMTLRTSTTANDVHVCLQGCYYAPNREAPAVCSDMELEWSARAPTACCDGIKEIYGAFLADLLANGLKDVIKPLIGKALCASDPCPTGSTAETAEDGTSTCYYDGVTPKACVPKALGVEGNLDLGSLIAKFAPGNAATFDVLAAVGGDLGATGTVPAGNNGAINPRAGTPNGVTIGSLAGLAIPKNKGLPEDIGTCIPDDVANPVPKDIPLPDELTHDTLANWQGEGEGPHVGVAISSRFLKYAVTNLYKQCVLSLGVTTDTLPAINSGILSLLLPSLGKLTQEHKAASIAIVTRPSSAPELVFGNGTNVDTDPHVALTLKAFSLDFYVWSADRYVRAFTWTADVVIPANLETGRSDTNPTGGLLPIIGKFRIENSTVSDAKLLFEDPKKVAEGLATTLPAIVEPMLGKIPPIDVNAMLKSLGVAIDLPKGGIRTLTKRTDKGTDTYLGVFASLSVPERTPVMATEATLVGKTVDPSVMTLETLDAARMPSLKTRFESPGAKADDIEYAYWIDEGTRSSWSSDPEVVIRSPYLFFQGKHTLNVVARKRGRTLSEDTTPAQVPFIIDTQAPSVTVTEHGARIAVDAWDFVSKEEDLVVRYRITSKTSAGAWTDWMPLAEATSIRASQSYSRIEVEVRDEEGNVGTADQPLVRGVDSSHGCACSTPGGADGAGRGGDAAMFLGGLVVVGGFLARRRRGLRAPRAAAAGVALFGASGLVQGCAEGVEHRAADDDGDETPQGGDACSESTDPLPVGLIGAYTSVAKAKDGALWVAGYNDSSVFDGSNALYGDLVVGKYDAASKKVAWETVDGLPPPRTDGSCAPYDPSGWRKGESDPGDNVGLWTSIQVGAAGTPVVSYFDQTNGALKFAAHDGDTWTAHTVAQAKDGKGDAGRYSKLVLVDGKPNIAFLWLEPGDGGRTRSRVVLARGKSATPKANGDWQLEDVYVDEDGPCRASFCGKGQICAPTVANQCLAEAKGCEDCAGADQACAMVGEAATCVTKASNTPATARPRAWGTDLSLASGPDGLAVVAFDLLRGDLVGVSNKGGKWGAPVVLDGPTRAKAENKTVVPIDSGVGTSLTIAANGDWHVTYARGFIESLAYLHIPGGLGGQGALPAPAIVDAGMRLDGKPFADGKHRVGDDSSISLGADGALSIVYQDATVGALRLAARAKGADAWAVRALEQPGKFAGFFPTRVDDAVVNWWRESDGATKTMAGDVALVTLSN